MISTHEFGQTGHASTRVIFGGYALSNATPKEAGKVLDLLLEYGVNHIDTAAGYGNSEKLIGQWMKEYRKSFFLATKTRSRGYKDAMRDLQKSFDLLKVDSIDLWQMHGLTNPAGREKAMSPGGVLEAFLEARAKGWVRYLGVTGHGGQAASMHIQSLERFVFDSVLLPYSYWQMQDFRYAREFNNLERICAERKIAIQTIKSIARRPWGEREKTYNTYFYEPIDEKSAIEKSIHWVLGLPSCFLITPGDIRLLPTVLDAASKISKRPSDEEMDKLVEELAIRPIFSY